VGLHLVLPLVGPFMEQHPIVRIELELEDRFTDVTSQKIDIGFRVSESMDRNVVARRLMDIQHWICASPDYLERHGRPRSWEDLGQHRCTGFRHVNTGKLMPWEYQEDGAITYRDVAAHFETNDVDAEASAVLAGVGIGQLPSYIAAPLIREGRLVHLLVKHTTERIGLYIYYAQRAHLPPRARLFIDFAVAKLLRKRPPASY
jgi:DNA-binding transcriptional LysR family regulator